MGELTFREAILSDVDSLLELEQKIIDSERPFDKDLKDKDAWYYDLPALISSAESHLVVVDTGAGIVGTGYVRIDETKQSYKHDQHGYIGFIYVEPEQRGKGVAKDILNHLVAWGKDRGIEHFALDVYTENESAIRAYEKFGFAKRSVKLVLET